MTEKLRLLSSAKAKRNAKLLGNRSLPSLFSSGAGGPPPTDKDKKSIDNEAPKSARHLKSLHDQFTRQNNGIIRWAVCFWMGDMPSHGAQCECKVCGTGS